jgi:hypothetical protein
LQLNIVSIFYFNNNYLKFIAMNYLKEYFSTAKCKSATKRHMRLCRQTDGASKYEQAILPAYNDLVAKDLAHENTIDNTYAAHDLVRLCDTRLDDLIIKLHHNCEDYDKEHVGATTRTDLFPSGNYGPIVSMNMYKEPASALAIATRIETFGATHQLFPFVALIRTAVTASEKSITDEAAAIKAEGAAKANAEIAKLLLVRQYNSNYHQAANDGGKPYAESLFPDFGGGNTDDDTDTTTTDTKKS